MSTFFSWEIISLVCRSLFTAQRKFMEQDWGSGVFWQSFPRVAEHSAKVPAAQGESLRLPKFCPETRNCFSLLMCSVGTESQNVQSSEPWGMRADQLSKEINQALPKGHWQWIDLMLCFQIRVLKNYQSWNMSKHMTYIRTSYWQKLGDDNVNKEWKDVKRYVPWSLNYYFKIHDLKKKGRNEKEKKNFNY